LRKTCAIFNAATQVNSTFAHARAASGCVRESATRRNALLYLAAIKKLNGINPLTIVIKLNILYYVKAIYGLTPLCLIKYKERSVCIMKKFIHGVAEFKFITALYFLAAMVLSMIGGYFNGITEHTFITIWQLLALSVIFGALHFIQLSKMAAPARIAIHCILSYIALIVFSLLCGWGFTEGLGVFLRFTLIFVLIYVVVFAAFAVYYRNEKAYIGQKLEECKDKSNEVEDKSE
jgi:hypothetical protein